MNHQKMLVQASFGRGFRLVLAFTSLIPAIVIAQTPAATVSSRTKATLAYDVAAIRPSKAENDNWSVKTNADTLSVENASVRQLLAEAYSVRQDLITKEPRWAESARFDIQAKILNADPSALNKLSDAERRVMLQALLAERFHLKVHTETTTQPVYDLVIYKGEAKLRKAKAAPNSEASTDADSFHGMTPGSMSMRPLDTQVELLAHAVTTKQIAFGLSYPVNRTVIDKTGLAGYYNVLPTWAPNNGISAAPEATAPSIFTALQEQLGLKLEAAEGPVDTLVVDRVDMPRETELRFGEGTAGKRRYSITSS